MSGFSCIVTPNSIAFVTPFGKTINVTDVHIAFDEMKATIKELQAALRAGDTSEADRLHHALAELAEPAKRIVEAGEGRVEVVDGEVFFEGQLIHNAVTRRILWGLGEGYDMLPYIRFLDNLLENPSKRAVDELYGFMEANNLGITDDGHLIAYKRVKDNYFDIYSGTVDHSIGQKPWMARNKVDDDKDRTCSYGFHFCSMSYLPHYGSHGHNRIVIVKINPRDVVSIPSDYNNAKARCNTYEVIGEYNGDDKEDILASKPIWTDSDWREDRWDDSEDEDSEDYDDSEDYNDDDDLVDGGWDDGDGDDEDESLTDMTPVAEPPSRQVFSVEVGNMPTERVEEVLEEVKQEFQNRTMLDEVAEQVRLADIEAAKAPKPTGEPSTAAFVIGPDGKLLPVFNTPLVPRYNG